MQWRVPNIWQDGTCWILGGGMSMPRQFGVPEDLIVDVVSGKKQPSCYSPYFEPIQMKHNIAVNQSFRIGYWPDMVFFGDNSFYIENKKDILHYPKIKVTSHHQHLHSNTIKYLKRDTKATGISDDPHTVCWNANSGAAAISIAANAGCKRIILLGFDMTMEDGKAHWHSLYRKTNKRPPRKLVQRNAQSLFSRHLVGFQHIARDAQKRKIEILNCSPISKIEQFPKVELKDII